MDKFGSTKCIEFDILNNGEQKITKTFTPKQLSEYIRIKHQEKKQWEDKPQELYQRVIETNNTIETIPGDLIEIYHKGLHIKSLSTWSIEKKENNICPSIIRCYDGDKVSITVSINKRFSDIEDSVENNVKEIGEYRSKFIRSTPKKDIINAYSTYSVGFAYKFDSFNRFGLVIGYQISSDLVAILHISCINDWSILCSELIRQIEESVKYEPQE